MQDPFGEIRRLQECISNLASLVSAPSPGQEAQPAQVLSGLLEALVSMLGLDFAYGRLKLDGGPAAPRGVPGARARGADAGAGGGAGGRGARKVAGREEPTAARRVPNPIGSGELSILHMRLGAGTGARGWWWPARSGAIFPRPLESLLLRMAVNEVLVQLQAAQLAGEQERADEIRAGPRSSSRRRTATSGRSDIPRTTGGSWSAKAARSRTSFGSCSRWRPPPPAC